MPILALEEKEKQKTLIFVFLGVVVLIFLVVFLGVFTRKQIFVVSPAGPAAVKKIEIDFGILDHLFLKEAETFDKPSLPKEKGRENPFLPVATEKTFPEEIISLPE